MRLSDLTKGALGNIIEAYSNKLERVGDMSEKRKIAILTSDRYLYQKLALELFEAGFEITENLSLQDTLIVDYDMRTSHPEAITVGYNEKADLVLPLTIGALTEKLKSDEKATLSVCDEDRTVVVFGKKVKLTEIEFSLFSLLYREKSLVSKERILKEIWKGEADGGVVNVYIHYLREKLETDGKKLILSSRQGGYRINELYL